MHYIIDYHTCQYGYYQNESPGLASLTLQLLHQKGDIFIEVPGVEESLIGFALALPDYRGAYTTYAVLCILPPVLGRDG